MGRMMINQDIFGYSTKIYKSPDLLQIPVIRKIKITLSKRFF